MTDSVGPVSGLIIHQFYNDETYWQGAWTEDEEFVDNGQVGGYRPFEDSAAVTVIGGDVYKKSGERLALTDFFRAWLVQQPLSLVVAVPEDRQAELESFLKERGFQFSYSRPQTQLG